MNENPAGRMGGRTVVLALLVSIAVGIAWLLWARGRAMDRPTPAVAVLPMTSTTFATDALAEGLTIDLINSLSKVEKLRVVGWNRAAQFRGKAAARNELRDQLGAGSVLESSIAKVGDRLQVQVKLVDTNSGDAIWSDSLDRPEREVFQIEERIAKGIVYALNVPMRVDPQRVLVPVQTQSMEAFRDYMEARAAASHDLKKSSMFAEKAIGEDVKYSPAYALLAANYGLFQRFDKDALPKARQFAKQAIDLDSSASEAHAALGMALGVGELDWPAARLELERAVQWTPGSAEAHAAYALGYLLPTNDLEGADYEVRQATQLDSASPYVNQIAALVAAARAQSRENFADALSKLAEGDLSAARAAATSGNADTAFAELDKAVDRHAAEVVFLQADPSFSALRKDPRYSAVLKRLRLRE